MTSTTQQRAMLVPILAPLPVHWGLPPSGRYPDSVPPCLGTGRLPELLPGSEGCRGYPQIPTGRRTSRRATWRSRAPGLRASAAAMGVVLTWVWVRRPRGWSPGTQPAGEPSEGSAGVSHPHLLKDQRLRSRLFVLTNHILGSDGKINCCITGNIYRHLIFAIFFAPRDSAKMTSFK